MSFPEEVLPVKVELNLGDWVNVTSDLTYRRKISISRGRADESNQVDRSTCDFELKNPSGDYSPRNPNGQYYGTLGRNTPVRISLPGEGYISLVSADVVSTPDAAALDITGDLDVRIELQRDDWFTAGCDLIGKYEPTGNQRSWAFYFSNTGSVNGYLGFAHTPTGSAAVQSLSTVPIPFPNTGRMALRCTIDVNNGSGGYTLTFYWSDSIDGTWNVLGDPVVIAGTTSIYNSTAPIKMGDSPVSAGWGGPNPGRIYAMQLRDGINGTVVSSFDGTNLTAGSSTFNDDQGQTWTLSGSASLEDRNYRFHGEVASWPQRWDVTGTDVAIPVQASGLLRRLGATSEPAGSPWKRTIIKQYPSLVGYWPLEDLQNSGVVAGGIPGCDPGTINVYEEFNYSTVQFASNSDFECSNALPSMNNSAVQMSVPFHTTPTEYQLRWLTVHPPLGGEDSTQNGLIRFEFTGGTIRSVSFRYSYFTGELGLSVYDVDSFEILNNYGITNWNAPGTKGLYTIELTQSGGDITWALAYLQPGAPTGPFVNGTMSGETLGRCTGVRLNYSLGHTDTAVGHVTVQTDVTSLYDFSTQLNAWRGETAGNRISRICSEESIAFQSRGNLADTVVLGAQPTSGTVLDVIRDAVDPDLGMLYEPLDMFGLGYRTRTSLLNQSPQIQTAYTDSTLSEPPEPADDDQSTVNDVTANRVRGSSSRAQVLSGPLSVQEPPSGVGRYAAGVSVNVNHDGQLPDQAAWRLRLGTDNNPRYPRLAFDMARSQIASNSAFSAAIAGAMVGDLIRITDPPSWLPPKNIDQIIEGWVEVMNNFEWRFSFNCSPGTTQLSAQYHNTNGDPINGYTWRYQPTATLLGEALDTTETGVDINVADDQLWTTTSGDYPFDIEINGERMTVTACTGSSSPQTLTVTRSVNGVVKSHSVGASVQLVDIAVYGM